MTTSDEISLNELFEFNLIQLAKKFKLVDGTIELFETKKAVELLNFAERLSIRPDDDSKIKSFLICALLWENQQAEWEALPSFISRILIKIGLNTSAMMIGWDVVANQFNSFGSFIEEYFSSVKLSTHEVRINNSSLTLSSFQKRMWDGIDQYARLGISAPTSAGKTYILVNKTIDVLSKLPKGKAVFVVPTISLINQVCNDFRTKLKEYGITDVSVSQTVSDYSLFKGDKIVYVLTQERALSALNHSDADWSDLKLLIIDEVQNIEKASSDDEERAKTLFDVIQEFKNDVKPDKIILCGPRLKNIKEIISEWFGESGFSVSEDIPAVINITYGFKIIKRSKLVLLTQYLPLGMQCSIEIEDKYLMRDKILGKVQYGDEVHDFIARLISCDPESGNIVFSNSTHQANETALALANRISFNNGVYSNDSFSIASFIAETVHPEYSLVKTIRKGIAFHHSKIPQHVRSIIEKAFSKKYINTIVSTTTLMQGINLPAKNIIIRNANLARTEKLTGYEFTNLKGRAGRLMKDLIGRAIIIDEEKCNKDEIQLNLFQEKNLNISYAERFAKSKSRIESALEKNFEVVDEKESGDDLVIYVRNIALKYREMGFRRIKDVGITISSTQYETVREHLRSLKIPHRICLNNPYWDPLVLNRIYLSYVAGDWPVVPNSVFGCSDRLVELLLKLRESSLIYYDKYFNVHPHPVTGPGKIKSLCIFAENWAAGRPLMQVINPPNWAISDSNDIDSRISDLHTKVVYGIPKLLRPIFQIHDVINKTATNSILSFIEVGSSEPRLRTLIEIGIPRETAIEMLAKISNSTILDDDGKVNEGQLRKFIETAKASSNINKWHKFLIADM